MKRRQFIKNTALLAAATGTGSVMQAANTAPAYPHAEGEAPAGDTAPAPLIASAPMLQNYAETSIGITFAVSALANGFVTYGKQPDLSDGKTVKCGGFRVTDISDKAVQIRLTGLEPATTYYYRIGANRIEYKHGYSMKVLGTEEDYHIYHFTTAGRGARGHFCVINDTHATWLPFSRCIETIVRLEPSCVIWNGDACNCEETPEDLIRIFLNPHIERRDYATQIPYIFCPGNHDVRGMANRHLERIWLYRQPEERRPQDWDLGRNFAVRMGEIALIGLDTAEDKLDSHPAFAGLFNSEAYRRAQVGWLEDALQRPEIESAPYLVAFCHIPLYDDNPRHNPGDCTPEENKGRYNVDFAMWQKTCGELWGPLLAKAGCQLVITAHQHYYRHFPATPERPWAQIIGGGPDTGYAGEGEKWHLTPGKYATVIEGLTEKGRLRINVWNTSTARLQDSFTYDPRKGKRK